MGRREELANEAAQLCVAALRKGKFKVSDEGELTRALADIFGPALRPVSVPPPGKSAVDDGLRPDAKGAANAEESQ